MDVSNKFFNTFTEPPRNANFYFEIFAQIFAKNTIKFSNRLENDKIFIKIIKNCWFPLIFSIRFLIN